MQDLLISMNGEKLCALCWMKDKVLPFSHVLVHVVSTSCPRSSQVHVIQQYHIRGGRHVLHVYDAECTTNLLRLHVLVVTDAGVLFSSSDQRVQSRLHANTAPRDGSQQTCCLMRVTSLHLVMALNKLAV